jgi:hypothetical protein
MEEIDFYSLAASEKALLAEHIKRHQCNERPYDDSRSRERHIKRRYIYVCSSSVIHVRLNKHCSALIIATGAENSIS